MADLMDPIILEPAGLTSASGWDECRRYVEQQGGLTYQNGPCEGEVNWRAAFGADPGVCSCPACHQRYWAWGTRQRCVLCAFEYPTDWWPMYSYGVGEAKRKGRGWAFTSPHFHEGLDRLHQSRMVHPYYRYGFEHPVDDAWKEHDRIDWRAALGEASR